MSKKGDGTLAWLRERNRQRVVGVLRERGRLSQAQIARATGLSRTTVHSLIGELKGWSMVQEVDASPPDGRGGRPAVPLGLRDSWHGVRGIDFRHSDRPLRDLDPGPNLGQERRGGS